MDSIDRINRAMSCSAILMLVASCGANVTDAPNDGQAREPGQIRESRATQGIEGSGLRRAQRASASERTVDGGVVVQGIDGSTSQGIEGTGLQGIQGSGLQGINGGGLQGIQGSGLHGIQGTGSQ
jgi:hypothetical protein